ncbi:HAD-IB family hydrolase [Trinickia symbiotica]|uniref:HAD-IB family hydrolase n=1 Tax=Trinickia symbiotica TaxID=863227 RepID=UPI0021592E25|nr:HAD-IB family hydrolase [Trinickia symbiotica]
MIKRAYCASETLSGHAQIVAAFDFDGTITTSDSLRDFVRNTVGNARLVSGIIRAAPWLVGRLIGTCDRGSAKAHFLSATLGGMTRHSLETAAQQYAANRLLKLIRPEMAVRVQEHRRRGHRLVLVSASPALYLEIWARSMGFEAVLATELEFRDDCFSGRLASPNCWGPEKARRLQQWFGSNPPPVLYVYGDSRGDKEILALADHGWLRAHGRMPAIDAWRGPTPQARST